MWINIHTEAISGERQQALHGRPFACREKPFEIAPILANPRLQPILRQHFSATDPAAIPGGCPGFVSRRISTATKYGIPHRVSTKLWASLIPGLAAAAVWIGRRAGSIRARACVLCAAAFVTLAFSAGAAVDTPRAVRVGVYQNKPKIFIEENGRAAGIFVELLEEMAAQENWKLVYVPCEWAACLQALEAGQIDLMPDVAFSPARDAVYDFHVTPVLESWSRVYASSRLTINKFSDLDGKRVALLEGSIQQTMFEQMMKGFGYSVTVVRTDSLEQAFALASDGSVDAAIANQYFGDYTFQEYGLTKTTIDFNPVTLYYATAEGKSHDLLEAIDRHLNAWLQETNSPYFQTLHRWMEKAPAYRVPQYFFWVIGGITGLLVFAAGMILLLRRQVRARTMNFERANTELQKSEEKLRLALEAANDGIWDWYPETGDITWSLRCYTMLGYQPDEFALNLARWIELLHPDDRADSWADVQRQINTGDRSSSVEFRFKRKDGGWAWINSRGKAVAFDKQGSIQRVIGTLTDITERKQAVEALQASERQLSTIYANINDVLFYLAVEPDDRFRFVSVNSAFLKTTGLTKNQIIGKLMQEVIPESAHAMVLGKYREAIRTKKAVRWEEVSEYPAGTKFGEVSVAPIFDTGGNCTHLAGTVHDITERRHGEEGLKASEGKFRAIFDNASDGMFLIDLKARKFFMCNAACVNMLGYSQEEFLNLDIGGIHPGEDLHFIFEQIEAFSRGEKGVRSDIRFKRKDGSIIAADLSPALITLAEKEYLLIIFKDITERKQHEREREAIIIMANALRSAPTRAAMLPVILDQLLEILQAEGAALVMRDPASGEILVEMARGEFLRDKRTHIPPGEGVSGHVIATGQPFLSNDLRREPRFTRPELLETIRAAACVPLIAQGQTIGALWVGRKGEIVTGEVRLLSAVADMAANAIQRTTLHEKTQWQVRRLAALHAIDEAITSSMDLRVTLDILLSHVIEQLGVDAAAVLLLNPQRQTLDFTAGRGFHTGAIEQSSVPLGQGCAGSAALERRIIQVPNLADSKEDFTRPPLLKDEGFTAYYAAPLVSKGQIKGVLEIFTRSPVNADPDWLEFLETLAGQAAIAIGDAELFEELQRSNTELSIAYDATIEGWSRALDLRDRETEGHTLRVTEMTQRLARAAGIRESDLVHLARGMLLHDIGKMGVPDSILLKPGPLTADEWVVMRRHPQLAYEMLSPIKYLHPALDIPYCHHEKWDGTGYPRGLKGEVIPLAARLFSVVDVWDALRSDRPYREAWPEKEVIEYIKGGSGTHFDPRAVELFLRVLKEEKKD
jgi:PAS domain S-box-containing protein